MVYDYLLFIVGPPLTGRHGDEEHRDPQLRARGRDHHQLRPVARSRTLLPTPGAYVSDSGVQGCCV